MPSSKFKIQKNCEVCGKSFFAKTLYSKYCSHSCSNIAYYKRKEKLDIDTREFTDRKYISILEAVSIFGISKNTIYRLIRNKRISALNLGQRLTRINRIEIEDMFPKINRINYLESKKEPYELDFNISDFYSIGEISNKFGISPSTVNNIIRKNSISKRQIGKFVYVRKNEIDSIINS